MNQQPNIYTLQSNKPDNLCLLSLLIQLPAEIS